MSRVVSPPYSIISTLMNALRPALSLLSTLRRPAIWLVLGLLAFVPLVVWAACDDRSRSLLLNTIFLSSVVCVVSIPVGTIVAFLLVRTDLPFRRLFGSLLGGMLLMPLYLQAAGWQAGFGLDGWYSLTSGDQ